MTHAARQTVDTLGGALERTLQAHRAVSDATRACANGSAMRDPGFWWEEPGLRSALLSPFAMVYGAVAAQRMQKAGARCSVPVLCVGNFTLGGAGKTPTAIMVAQMLTAGGAQALLSDARLWRQQRRAEAGRS